MTEAEGNAKQFLLHSEEWAHGLKKVIAGDLHALKQPNTKLYNLYDGMSKHKTGK